MDINSLHRKDDRDYDFILGEIERFVGKTAKELMDYFREHREDAFFTIPRPAGGTLPFTKAGEERFYQITARGLETLGSEAWKYDASKIVAALKSEFISCLLGQVQITEKNAHLLFERALLASASGHQELTHYIPCFVVAHRRPEIFSIGPVKFVYRERFIKENESGLQDRGHASGKEDWALEDLKSFFSQFSWIAHVTVPPCDEDRSRERAHKTVQRALDIFKLFVGLPRAFGVRQGYDLRAPSATVDLVSSTPGKFSISSTRSNFDAVVNDDWYKISEWETWKLAADVIRREYDDTDLLAEPELKFLNGLEWHGNAISDPNHQSKVLNFWTAIEQTLSVRYRDNCVRKAALLTCEMSTFSKCLRKYDSLYGKRASVTHGLTSPNITVESAKMIFEMERISRSVLLNYLVMLNRLRAARRQLTLGAVDLEFRRLLHICKS